MKNSFHYLRKCLFVFCLFVSTGSVSLQCIYAAGEFRFESITTKNGLSQNTVRCLLQDHRGFIWMGTMNGLNRYDGRSFLVMQPRFGEKPSLSDNRIRSLFEDKNGFIWIRTNANIIDCYDTRLESFVHYCEEGASLEYSELMEASNGNIWLYGGKNGCMRIRYENGRFETRPYGAAELGGARVNFIYESSDGTLWIGTKSGLSYLDGDRPVKAPGTNVFNFHQAIESGTDIFFFTNDNRILVFDRSSKTEKPQIEIEARSESLALTSVALLCDGWVAIGSTFKTYLLNTHTRQVESAKTVFGDKEVPNVYFYIDNKRNLWAHNRTGSLWRYRKDSGVFEEIRLIPQSIISLIDNERFSVYHDSNHTIWITTYGNGLFALDAETGAIRHLTQEMEGGNGLYSNHLLCVMEDRSGEVWVGTEHAGVSKISRSPYKDKVFFPEGKPVRGDGNSVRLIYEDRDNNIWVGSRNGNLHLLDSRLNKRKTIPLPSGMPYAMAEDTAGNKWLGVKAGGILVSSSGSFDRYKVYTMQNTPSLGSNNIYSVLRDNKGRMWVGSFGGGLCLAEKRGEGLYFTQFLNQRRTQKMVRCAIQDKDGYIWVGSDDGVNVFNPDSLLASPDNFVRFGFSSTNELSLNNNEVKTILEDSSGRIWLGTAGGGLNLAVKGRRIEDTSFRHYTSRQGLTNDVVQAILEDDDGMIWVSSESGISKFNPKTESFENFTFSNVWQGDLFGESAACNKKDGQLMFGSYRGMYVFNPFILKNTTYSPPVVITGLKINGKNAGVNEEGSPLTESIATTSGIKLRFEQNSFNIEFAMLSYHDSHANRYTYILEGYEQDWNPITYINQATYRNVPPGRYVFKVRACNSAGVWTDEETTMEILVVPPWWKSAQAFLFYFLFGALLAFVIYKLVVRMNRLHNAVEVEKQLTEYKLRFFTNISHEFRTPLSLIQGSIENLSGRVDVPRYVQKQIRILEKSSARLLRLIDQLLEFRRLQNNKMELNLEMTEAVGFFQNIWQIFSETAEKKKMEFLFEPEADCIHLYLDRSKMDKIAYNLLSNAFKYTPEGGKVKMSLSIDEVADLFILQVSDSGPGIAKEKQASLFVRFRQINYSSSGTGIGLHLTSELATVHKGCVFYSDSEWGGSSFTVQIPLSDSLYEKGEFSFIPDQNDETIDSSVLSPKDDNHEPFADENTLSLKNYILLLIEDDEEIRDFLSDQLGEFYGIITANDGLSGLGAALEKQPDLIVCDVMMPEMDGFEVTRRLKENIETSHIPIIILTAHASPQHQLEGIEVGADAYITKPFSIKYLRTRVFKLIEQRRKLQMKFLKEPGLSTVYSTEKDKEFLEKMHEILRKNMSNPAFSVEMFAQEANMGRTAFYKKIKGLTGSSPNEYIRIVRMKKALELLTSTSMNVSEAAREVGIPDAFYFSRCFKSQFGCSPSAYLKKDAKK